MSNQKISASQIPTDVIIYVRGTLRWSRLASQVAGDELRQRSEEAKRRGGFAIDRPYTEATIDNATLLLKDPNNGPDLAETYINQRFYTSNSAHSAGGYSFTAQNKGNYLPRIAERQSDNSFKEVRLDNELSAGLDVTLVLRTFAGNHRNNGVSLDAVLVNEPIRYFNQNNTLETALKQHGFRFQPLPEDVEYVERKDQKLEENANFAIQNAPAASEDTSQFAQAFEAPPSPPYYDEGFFGNSWQPPSPSPQQTQAPPQPKQGQGIVYDPTTRGY